MNHSKLGILSCLTISFSWPDCQRRIGIWVWEYPRWNTAFAGSPSLLLSKSANCFSQYCATAETVFDSSPSCSVSVNPPESEEQSMSELGHSSPYHYKKANESWLSVPLLTSPRWRSAPCLLFISALSYRYPRTPIPIPDQWIPGRQLTRFTHQISDISTKYLEKDSEACPI